MENRPIVLVLVLVLGNINPSAKTQMMRAENLQGAKENAPNLLHGWFGRFALAR